MNVTRNLMSPSPRFSCFVLWVLLIVGGTSFANAQDSKSEFWPELDIWQELQPNLNMIFMSAVTRSRETRYTDALLAATVDYRWFPQEIWPFALSFRVGYQYAWAIGADAGAWYDTIIPLEVTPRYYIADDLILFDRSRVELRWVNSAYSTRYRNRLRLEYRPTVWDKLLTLYFSCEIYYDSRAESWNRNRIQLGVEIPVAWKLSVEPSFTFQNTKGSEPAHVRALGLTACLYL
jgi:hypothetical protein